MGNMFCQDVLERGAWKGGVGMDDELDRRLAQGTIGWNDLVRWYKENKQELADVKAEYEAYIKSETTAHKELKKELDNAVSLKNTYHDNWQKIKGTVDSQAKVINNLTVRWGKKCREHQELLGLVEGLLGAKNSAYEAEMRQQTKASIKKAKEE